MSIAVRSARELPEARSRLLRYLENHAAGEWVQIIRRDGIRYVTGVDSEHGMTFDGDLDSGFLGPASIKRDTPEATAAALADWQAAGIRAADLHYVSEEMTDLVMHAGRLMPNFPLHPQVLPHEVGLLAWAKPLEARPGTHGGDFHTIGASWVPSVHGVWITLYDDVSGVLANLPTNVRAEARAMFGKLVEGMMTLVPWADRIVLSDTWGPSPQQRRAMMTLVATWLLMGQTITASHRETPRPKDSRRIARRGHPTEGVTSVTLRRQRTVPEQSASGEKGREYRHRWIVDGHWRNQWYPSVGVHRPIWISPYLKGPDSAPLLHREKVYTLRR